MGDRTSLLRARESCVLLGHELELEHSLELKTGFKGVREVRGNKEGARFQAKVYVQGQGPRVLPSRPSAAEAATDLAAFNAGLLGMAPKALRNSRRSKEVSLPAPCKAL